MQRRDFIKVMGAGTGIILIPSIFTGCSNQPLKALDAWQGPSQDQKDIRIIVLSYAILAPNPHNKQPWIVDLKSPNTIDLYVDQTRLLPETDPPARQIHIGQGTFIENLVVAAKAHKYRTNITYFPKGMYSNSTIENKPIASIELIKDENVAQDPLFDVILKRQSNKRAYEDRELPASEIMKVSKEYGRQEYPLFVTSKKEHRAQLAEMLGKAMEIETSGEARHEETVKMFRFNDDEVEKYRDGFGVANSGMTGFKKMIVETFFLGNREEAKSLTSSFAKATIDLTTDQAKSAAAFAWIMSKTNTRLDQVKVGRAYNRINLIATKNGLAMHPMSQILEEYSEMASLQKKLHQFLDVPQGHTVQMLFRLGYADPVVHSARRNVKDLVKRNGVKS